MKVFRETLATDPVTGAGSIPVQSTTWTRNHARGHYMVQAGVVCLIRDLSTYNAVIVFIVFT